MLVTKKRINELTHLIIGAAIEVHKTIGPGLLESAYEICMAREMDFRNLEYKRQMTVPINYKGQRLSTDYRLDFLVEDLIVVELKVAEKFIPIHDAQILTYMSLLQKSKGILLNFNCTNIFEHGQKTIVNKLFWSLPD
jgi:GxxExxY protein